MPNFEQLHSQLVQLPLGNRLVMLNALEKSVSDEFERLAKQSLDDDIALCEHRLEELDSGKTQTVSWESVRHRVFGNS